VNDWGAVVTGVALLLVAALLLFMLVRIPLSLY
jgi:hypothetical protein